MDDTQQSGDEQAKHWNGRAGQAWVESQELLDQVLKPFEELLLGAVSTGPGDRVLDVGCGAGTTTLAVARAQRGHAVGIDISEPMITAARSRAERTGLQASFIRANAQDYAFEPASFDMVISRFGVMFFEDAVQAFANLRRAAKAGAALRFVAWRSPLDNPFMTTAERAAAPLLPNLPAYRADAPGRFAFADRLRVQSILEQSGWSELDIRPIDLACSFPEHELVRYLTKVGPLAQAFQEADEPTRARVIETVRAAFDPFVQGPEVRFTASCWDVSARAPLG